MSQEKAGQEEDRQERLTFELLNFLKNKTIE